MVTLAAFQIIYTHYYIKTIIIAKQAPSAVKFL